MVKVNWENMALAQLKEACGYIKRDSLKNSLKVKNDIFELADSLALHPEKHPLDKYKIENDGTYRAFTLHRYRVAYRVITTEIKILRLRHTSREPLEY